MARRGTYTTLKGLKRAFDEGHFADCEFTISVDNDQVAAIAHPGWDEDGEELGEPEYVWTSDSPREALHEAMKLLGLPSEDC